MTLSTTTNREPNYTGNGVTTVFPYNFRVFLSSDLTVIQTDTSGNETTLVEGTDYTVSGVGSYSGGSVTTTVPVPNLYGLSILREVDLTQPTSITNQGAFYAKTHEDVFDRLTMIDQQQENEIKRAIKLPKSIDTDMELDPPVEGTVLGWVSGVLRNLAAGTAELAANLLNSSNTALGDALVSTKAPYTGAAARSQHLKNLDLMTFRDWPVVGDGSTDDNTAIGDALSSVKRLDGHIDDSYKTTTTKTLTGSLILDLNGGTLKPTGNILGLSSSTPTTAATSTISSGATLGSRSVVVASATGMAIGQWIKIDANDSPTNDANSYPTYWGTITNVSGTTITLDRPLPVGYSGTISVSTYASTAFKETLIIRNGKIDGSANTQTATSGNGLRICGFKRVLLDNVELSGFTAQCVPLQIYQCLDVEVRGLKAIGGSIGGSAYELVDIQECRTAKVIGGTIDGAHFGVSFVRCEFAKAHAVDLMGRRTKDAADGINTSIRGIKFYGCYNAIAIGNQIQDYESPIKVQACFRHLILGNSILNSGTVGDTSCLAINVGSQAASPTNQADGIIAHNTIENHTGGGIGMLDNTANGRTVIHGNIIRNCGSYGIYSNIKNQIITNNIIENWGTAGAFTGIHYSSGVTATGNRFHNTNAARVCFRNFLSIGYRYVFRDNATPDGNPLGVVVESNGTATVASGTTSIAVTHNLNRTPLAEEISITATANTTNAIDNVYITAIGATTFTVNVRADPGAGGFVFRWRVNTIMPFTA